MPVNTATVVAVVGLVLGLGVWFRTKRIGPVFGVLIGAFVIMAITTPSVLTQGGKLIGRALTWATGLFTF